MTSRLFDPAILEEAKSLFPYEEARSEQLETIAEIVTNFRNGTKHQILEAPTGAGKSIIALVVGQMMKTSFYLTSSKMLQSQIANEFGIDNGSLQQIIADLKGRNAYDCNFYDIHGEALVLAGKLRPERLKELQMAPRDCGSTSHCRKHLGRAKCRQCFPPQNGPTGDWHAQFGNVDTTCQYYSKVFDAVRSPHVLLNYHSFLFQTSFTENFMHKKGLMILDEAHNAYKVILDFVQVTLIQDMIDEEIPVFEEATEYAEWALENDLPNKLAAAAQEAFDKRKIDESEKLLEMSNRLNIFIYSASDGHDWIRVLNMDSERRNKIASVVLKPVMASDFTDRYYFNKADHFLHMSATILSSKLFAKNLGIKDFKYTRMNCDFPIKNRTIYLHNSYKASGGKGKQHEWEPKLIKAVDTILQYHPEERGIIHTHNFSISKAILDKTKFKSRFLSQLDFRSKEEMLQAHSEKKASVIVAPAMHEGIDLKDDLSRFQIIAKCPYPNPYEDEQLARLIKHFEIEGMWDYITALKLVQSAGRSVRHKNDWAKTYIIDGVACDFITSKGKKFIPPWFSEAVKKIGGK